MYLLHKGREDTASRVEPRMDPEEPKQPTDSLDSASRQSYGPDRDVRNYDSIFDSPVDGLGPGELVKEIATDLSQLVRKEVDLARLELKEIVGDAVRALGLSGLALALAVLLLPLVVLTLIEVLAIWLPRWSATLIITGVIGSVAVTAFLIARRLFRKRAGSGFVPEKTVQSIKEDVQWAKNLKKQ